MFTSKKGGFTVEIPPGTTVNEEDRGVTVRLRDAEGLEQYHVTYADIPEETLKKQTGDQYFDEKARSVTFGLQAERQ